MSLLRVNVFGLNMLRFCSIANDNFNLFLLLFYFIPYRLPNFKRFYKGKQNVIFKGIKYLKLWQMFISNSARNFKLHTVLESMTVI